MYLAQPAGDPRLFVVERAGRVRILQGGVGSAQAFLDISGLVENPFQGEGGLLSMVFAPDYATSGVFYVYYTGRSATSPVNMRSVVSRFTVSGNPLTATDVDEGTEQQIFELDQPFINHKGGTIAIRDGYLYLGLGDGGDGGDPFEAAQDDANKLGKLLRLDLATPSPDADDWELVAKGLRNPFRWSFDRTTGDLYIGDVGQGIEEEIDAVAAADLPVGDEPPLNFGWDVKEGNRCFEEPDPGEPECDDPSLIDPVFVYDHPAPGEPGAVIGGAVYRGAASRSMRGDYFFTDWTKPDFLYRMRWTPEGGVEEAEDIGNLPVDVGNLIQIVAICEDAAGEIHLVSRFGNIHRLVPEPHELAGAAVAIGALAWRRTRRAA